MQRWGIQLITIANPGLGNFVSIANMYKFLEFDVEVLSDPSNLSNVTHLILPGVGAFDNGMKLLADSGWKNAILNLDPNVNILGICLGMQLLTSGSEEGSLSGLGLVDAYCRRIPEGDLSVPHMGWNEVINCRKNELLHSDERNRFYFSHSYYVELNNRELGFGNTSYGFDFTSGYKKNNIFGVQFHPEKSHKYGMRLLRRFAEI